MTDNYSRGDWKNRISMFYLTPPFFLQIEIFFFSHRQLGIRNMVPHCIFSDITR